MRNIRFMAWLAAFASVMLLGATMVAQSTTTSTRSQTKANPQTSNTMGANNNSTRTGGVPTKDHTFMTKAAQGGMAEVELGQLAEQNASSQQVKDFGKRMVDDHTKANDQLKQVASQKGVSLPTDLDAKDKATKDRLSKLKGDAFDKAYMKDMVTDHKKDVAEFKHEADTGNDPDVKNFASQTLPTLQEHLKLAEQTEGQTSKEGSKSASASQPQ